LPTRGSRPKKRQGENGGWGKRRKEQRKKGSGSASAKQLEEIADALGGGVTIVEKRRKRGQNQKSRQKGKAREASRNGSKSRFFRGLKRGKNHAWGKRHGAGKAKVSRRRGKKKTVRGAILGEKCHAYQGEGKQAAEGGNRRKGWKMLS